MIYEICLFLTETVDKTTKSTNTENKTNENIIDVSIVFKHKEKRLEYNL